MKINLQQENGITTAVIDETRLDASVAPEFMSEMDRIITSGNDQIIIDISKLSFMDSSSLGAMVSVLKKISATGKMVIFGASGTVLELFKLTRMDRIFTLTNDLETAKTHF
ncbi:anti-sigma factor antagonist [Leucothrix sargassi]|nr:anti-sigma factor antagonist [Leucothrix sargassi]